MPDNEYVLYKVVYNGNAETETSDSHLKPFRYFSKYNLNVNLTEEQTSTVPAKLYSYIYGYNNNHQIAAIENAKLDDVAYTSFESAEYGNWTLSASPVFDLSSVTGTRLYDLAKGSITKSNLTPSTSYYFTYWTKNTVSYAISGTQGTPTLLAARNGWNCYQHLLTGINALTLAGNGYIDELRLYPVGAKMTTATYEPLIGMTSKNDDNNQVTYYNYDEFNRLQYIRDNGKNIIQAYCYNFNGEAGNCFTTVSNQAQSGSFNRNNCGKGVRGSSVTYTVPAGRYVASTQQGANGLAQIEIDQNGQNYANANGTCSSLTLYAKIEYSNYTGDSWSDPNTGEQASSSLADVTIKLYSDAAGSVPFVLDRTITVIVTEGSTQTTAYNGTVTGSSNTNYTISAGQSSLSLGHRLLSSYGQYLDPYSGSGFIYESSDYTYNVVDNNDEYVSL
ncbi:DUF5977 domain-containing protein [Mucilaginibacter kameinonensis]|uniref:DUF5977 domain-containing protein n=1 Tax=Mucilaginibacter kameinonensis TaxID=452286 RepID=UPI000EF804A0|nr:DUF5977 domain-containing protein [Mucilaginibacter kameinonensis]